MTARGGPTSIRGVSELMQPHRGYAGATVTYASEGRLVAAAAAGEERAREQLIETFAPRIRAISRRYRRADSVTEEELLQEGVVGLLRALTRYRPERGVPFWGYAAWWVRQAMQCLVAELTHPVVLSDRAFRQLARVSLAQREYAQTHRRQPTVHELAERTGFSAAHIRQLWAADQLPRSLSEPLGEDGETSSVVGDQLADPGSGDGYDRVEQRQRREAARDLGGNLTEREREVVRARYGLRCSEQTLQQVAARVGVTPERVRQIQNGALEKLRAEVESAFNQLAAG